MIPSALKKLPIPRDLKTLKILTQFQKEQSIQFYTYFNDIRAVPFYKFKKISSTMQIARQWVKQIISCPAAFIADCQTQGVGQKTNKWVSPLNNIYLTFLCQVKPQALQHLSILVSCAIKRTLKQQVDLNVKFKWINDIFLQNKKLGGILIQTQIVNNKILALIGIGINVGSAPIETSTCINKYTNKEIDLLQLASKIIYNILFYLNKNTKQEIIQQYSQNLMFLNEMVSIKDATYQKTLYEGILQGVNINGNAILKIQGEKVVVSDGRMIKKQ